MNIREENRATLENACRDRRGHFDLNADVLCARALGDFSLLCLKRDLAMTPCIVYDGFWQIWLWLAMVKLVREGTDVIDVGANIGFFTMGIASLVGEHGTVHAIEPLIDQSELLARSARINSLDSRIEIYQVAVGAKEERRRIMYTIDNQTSATLAPFAATNESTVKSQDVQVKTLDSLIKLKPMRELSLLKIDAEGMDYEVITGAKNLLRQHSSCAIVFEHSVSSYDRGHADHMNANLIDLVESGYNIDVADFDGNIHPVDVGEIIADPKRSWDLVARRR